MVDGISGWDYDNSSNTLTIHLTGVYGDYSYHELYFKVYYVPSNIEFIK